MNTLSLDAAVALTGISRSTLIRRVREGVITAGQKDADNRSTLVLSQVLSLAGLSLGAEDRRLWLCADAGDALAQADLGALCYVRGHDTAALYWLHKAAEQNQADALQWLGVACAAGRGGGDASDTQRNESMALMWIARAAALGQSVARQQVQALLAGVVA